MAAESVLQRYLLVYRIWERQLRGDASAHEVIVDVDKVVLAQTLVVVKTCAEADVSARKETTNRKSDSCIV